MCVLRQKGLTRDCFGQFWTLSAAKYLRCQSGRGCSALLFTNELHVISMYMLGLLVIELDRCMGGNCNILDFLPLFQVSCISWSFSISFCADTLKGLFGHSLIDLKYLIGSETFRIQNQSIVPIISVLCYTCW